MPSAGQPPNGTTTGPTGSDTQVPLTGSSASPGPSPSGSPKSY